MKRFLARLEHLLDSLQFLFSKFGLLRLQQTEHRRSGCGWYEDPAIGNCECSEFRTGPELVPGALLIAVVQLLRKVERIVSVQDRRSERTAVLQSPQNSILREVR